MKTIKKIAVIFAIVICILLLKQDESYAMTQEEAGSYIASYAINFCNNKGGKTVYEYSPSQRKHSIMTGQPSSDGIYHLECAGFASMVVKQSINVESPGGIVENGNGKRVFFEPSSDMADWEIFERVEGELKPGDILANTHHIMVYVGNNMIVHCDGHGYQNNGNGAISYESIDNYKSRVDSAGYIWACRIREDVAAGLSEGNSGGGIIDSITGAISGAWDSITSFVGELFGENDEEFKKGTPLSAEEENKLYYKGIANEVGRRTEEVKEESTFDFTFPKITTIIDYLVGSIIYPVRASVTGFANIVQIEVSNYVAAASGEKSDIKTDDGILTNLKQKMENSLTLEKIVYNQVPVLDVNIFNLNKAGGKDIKSDSLAGIVRNIASNWYYIFRTITIIALLVILIYIGIKIAITSVASEKAAYKEFLVNWLIAFIVVFAMPYLMILIMQINESLVSIFAGMGKQLNLYETVRELTWSAKMSTGVIGTMLYVTLVYYLVKFVVLYFKRLFVTVILIVIAPLVAGKYAYDKVRGGKGDNSLGKWFQEFTFSVMMQTVHALVYTVFISMTINIVTNSSEGSIIAMIILSLIFFNFMTKSERIVRSIINLNSNKAVSFGDADSTAIHDLIGWSYLKKATGSQMIYKPMYNMTKNYLGKKINNDKTMLGKLVKFPENVYVEQQKEKLKKQYGATYRRNKNAKTNMYGDIDKQLDYAIREKYHMNIETLKSFGSTGVNLVSGMGKSIIAIPLFVAESPILGVETFFSGISTLRYAAGVPIEGYKKLGSQKFTSNSKVYKTMETLATGGMNKTIRNIVDVYGQKLDILKNYKPEQIRLLYKSQQLTGELIGELEQLKDKEFKGYQEGSNPLEQKLAEKYQEKLEQCLEESQKTVAKDEIKEKIESYEEEKQKVSLTTRDLNNIAKKLQKVDVENSKNNIIIRKEIENSIKDQLATGMVNNIIGIKDEYKKLTVDDSSIDSMIDKVKERINTLNENGVAEDSKEKQAANLSLSLLEQKKAGDKVDFNNLSEEQNGVKENLGADNSSKEETKEDNSSIDAMKEKLKERINALSGKEIKEDKVDFKNLSEEEQNGVKEVLKEAITEEDMNNTTQKMGLDDLAQLMKISVDTKGSIEKAPVPIKFGGVVEKAEELRKINEKMGEMTNKTIDENGKLASKEAEPIYQTQDLINMANRVIKSPNNE